MNKGGLNVLHISTGMTWRGGERQLLYLVNGLSERAGFNQAILLPGNSELLGRVKGLPLLVQTFNKYTGISLRGVAALRRLVRHFKPDIIHAHDSHAHNIVFLYNVIHRPNFPYVISRRVAIPAIKSPLSSIKYRDKHLQRIICVSDYIRDGLIDQGIRSDVAVTIHSGIDLPSEDAIKNLFRDMPKKEHVLIGNFGSMTPDKDQLTFIRAAAQIHATFPDWRFMIVGSGPLLSTLENERNALGMNDVLEFKPFCKDYYPVLATLDILANSSQTEGLGTILIDALALGIPVASSDTGGIPELIIPGQTGLLSPKGDHKGLADNVMKILADPQLKENLIRNGKAHARKFTRQRMTDLTKMIYFEVQSKS